PPETPLAKVLGLWPCHRFPPPSPVTDFRAAQSAHLRRRSRETHDVRESTDPIPPCPHPIDTRVWHRRTRKRGNKNQPVRALETPGSPTTASVDRDLPRCNIERQTDRAAQSCRARCRIRGRSGTGRCARSPDFCTPRGVADRSLAAWRAQRAEDLADSTF